MSDTNIPKYPSSHPQWIYRPFKFELEGPRYLTDEELRELGYTQVKSQTGPTYYLQNQVDEDVLWDERIQPRLGEQEFFTGFATEVNTMPITPQAGMPEVWELCKADLLARADFGFRKYGQPMTPHCGRDPLIDVYQELLDALLYTRQALFEKYGR